MTTNALFRTEAVSTSSTLPSNFDENDGIFRAFINGINTWSPIGLLSASNLAFLPDFTEHPKPRKRKPPRHENGDGNEENDSPPRPPEVSESDEDSDEITFFYDFVAGGVAGTASVIVGHPFDT